MTDEYQTCIDPVIPTIANCPCCGCIATFQIEVDDLGRICCHGCGLKTQLTTKSNAIKLWNRRDGCEIVYVDSRSIIDKIKSYMWL